MVFYGPSCLFKASFLLPAVDGAEFFPEQEHPSTCASHKKRLPVVQAVLMGDFGGRRGRGGGNHFFRADCKLKRNTGLA